VPAIAARAGCTEHKLENETCEEPDQVPNGCPDENYEAQGEERNDDFDHG
jgi:hypothetical protein